MVINEALRGSAFTIEEAWRVAQSIRNATSLSKDTIGNRSETKRGPYVSQAKRRFIDKLSDNFREAGGNPTVHYDAHKESYGSPFINFVAAIETNLPPEFALAVDHTKLAVWIKNYLKTKTSG